MRNVIHKIFSNEFDERVHEDFVKFSRGVFENRYLIEGKRQKDKWAIKTSAEFANYFVQKCLEKVSGKIAMKGAIVCTFSLEGKIGFERVKQFAGVKQHLIESEVVAEEVLSLMNEHPKAFYALSFSSGDFDLKIKAKPPKSGKPGKKGRDEPKADFCTLKTTDEELVKDLFFDFPVFKEIRVKHTIEINDIEIPKDAKTPEEMREKALRKGVVRRFVDVGGEKKESEKSFEV